MFYNVFFGFLDELDVNLVHLVLSYMIIGGSELSLWIIRIFISISLLAPMLLRLGNRINSNYYFYLFIIMSLIIYELFVIISRSYFDNFELKIFDIIFMYTISYSLVFMYGTRILFIQKKELLCHVIFFYFC